MHALPVNISFEYSSHSPRFTAEFTRISNSAVNLTPRILSKGRSVRLPCASAVKHLLYLYENLIVLVDFWKEPCFVGEKATTLSQKISGTVPAACINRCS